MNGLHMRLSLAASRLSANLAAAQGDEAGRENRDKLAKKMTPAQVAEAQKLAREWMEKHLE